MTDKSWQSKQSPEEKAFFQQLRESALIPVDRGRIWQIAAEKSGMTVEELWFDMNRTNAFIGAAPFYGGNAEGFAEFMALHEGNSKT